ncbi:MAG: site-2 protease family protein, partial [Ruminococcaceae bacterium]|nr:site-2 protease family protein [Oscillospiraceae bacterium]
MANTPQAIQFLLSIPVVLIALVFHEVSHGYAAYKLGDPTARSLGRLSLNPLKHLDPVGALCMLIFRFGWARPVPINS